MSESYIITSTNYIKLDDDGIGVLVGLSIITLGALLLFLLIRICIDCKKCCGNEDPTRIVLQDIRTVQVQQDVERNRTAKD